MAREMGTARLRLAHARHDFLVPNLAPDLIPAASDTAQTRRSAAPAISVQRIGGSKP
jgi:hypothetical protein